ncbi:hypothetical protein [Marinobacter sp. BGYM27]|nr:hypothetical protein [Marinobacter sp. BGYM27]MDG5500356.1 hypothetical protein [Marinobacter sp. BGYM27]
MQNRLFGALVVGQSGEAIYRTAHPVLWFLAPLVKLVQAGVESAF